jgi:hypothetical protein
VTINRLAYGRHHESDISECMRFFTTPVGTAVGVPSHIDLAKDSCIVHTSIEVLRHSTEYNPLLVRYSLPMASNAPSGDVIIACVLSSTFKYTFIQRRTYHSVVGVTGTGKSTVSLLQSRQIAFLRSPKSSVHQCRGRVHRLPYTSWIEALYDAYQTHLSAPSSSRGLQRRFGRHSGLRSA